MKNKRNMLIQILAIISMVFVSFQTYANDSYILSAGDSIEISVHGEEDLSKKLMITNSGHFSYPFLGRINAKGLTVAELEKSIYDGLKGDYLIHPNVQVRISKYRPFYISGSVGHYGAYAYHPGLTVGQAIALAGGVVDEDVLFEYRLRSENDVEATLSLVDLTSFVYPGDILYVAKSNVQDHFKEDNSKRVNTE